MACASHCEIIRKLKLYAQTFLVWLRPVTDTNLSLQEIFFSPEET